MWVYRAWLVILKVTEYIVLYFWSILYLAIPSPPTASLILAQVYLADIDRI